MKITVHGAAGQVTRSACWAWEATYVPGLSDVVKRTQPSAMGWFVVIGFSHFPLV